MSKGAKYQPDVLFSIILHGQRKDKTFIELLWHDDYIGIICLFLFLTPG